MSILLSNATEEEILEALETGEASIPLHMFRNASTKVHIAGIKKFKTAIHEIPCPTKEMEALHEFLWEL